MSVNGGLYGTGGLAVTVLKPRKTIWALRAGKRLIFREEACNYCGRCVRACPTGAWEGRSGFMIYFGGLFGNRIAIGKKLLPIVFTTNELFRVVDAALMFYEKHGKSSERFRNTVDRVGWELLEKEVASVL